MQETMISTPDQPTTITLKAECDCITIGPRGRTMTLKIGEVFLRVPWQEGVEPGDVFVVVMSKVHVPREGAEMVGKLESAQ